MWPDWLFIALAVLSGVLLLWLLLIAALWFAKPDDVGLREVMRLLPDVVRLLTRLAADRAMPRAVRVSLALLLAYLVLPVDIVPDFVPVLGYADDAIIVALILRYVARKAGAAALQQHWPGTPEGFAALLTLCRLHDAT